MLFEEIELPKTRKMTTGWTTDANALEPLRHVHPAVDAVLQWPELSTINSTYVDTLPRQATPRTGGGRRLGESATAFPQAARRAEEAGGAVDDELAHLLGNGVLHLLGHGHQSPKEGRAMRAREEALLGRAAH